MTAPTNAQSHATLKREVGLAGAVALGLGSMLGTGVFVGLGIAASYTGSGVLLAVVLSAMLALCNALSSAQLAAAHPVSGGTYAYGYRYLTPWFGFTAGWVFICAKCASAATAALACAAYGLAMADANTPMRAMILALALLALLTILVLSGLRRSNALNTVLVSAVALSLLTFVVVCVFNRSGAAESLFTTGPYANVAASEGPFAVRLLAAAALTFVAYTGYGRVATLGEEVHEPRRTIPRAIMLVMACTAALYIAVAGAALIAVGPTAFAVIGATSDQPLRAITESLAPEAIAQVISIGALLAMLGVVLNLLLGVSRVVLAMGREGDLPRVFAKLDKSQRTPVAAVILTAVIMAGLICVGDLRLTWSFSAFTVLIYYAITNLAALRLPRKDRLYPRWISIAGLVGCLSLAWFVEMRIWIVGIVLIAAGLAWRLAATRLAGRNA